MLQQAPFHADLAHGPEGSRAYWCTSKDGVKLRLGLFPAPKARGTILMFPGRTEYVEKYGRPADELAQHGYSMLCIDWRGQGMAQRLLDDPVVGHVGQFTDYQFDVDAMLQAAKTLNLPKPWYLMAHSMGGCIGLRSLMRGMPVDAAVFTGPMWGIHLPPLARSAAWAISWGGIHSGLGHRYVPGTRPQSYVIAEDFEDNALTTDQEMWLEMRRQIEAEPLFRLGGPSLQWLNESLRECRILAHQQSPNVPCLTFVGSNERIVDTARITERMENWNNGHLRYVPGGEHEVLMEGPALRRRIIGKCLDLFEGRRVPECSYAKTANG